MAPLSSEDAKAKKAESGPSAAVEIGLDAAATVWQTLETVAKLSPIPGLSQAAAVALQITTAVQTVRRNKTGFQDLAEDCRRLVYVIFYANRDVKEVEDVPGLTEHLDRVLEVLLDVKKFAKKGSSRNMFNAFIRARVDSQQILNYRQKLQQCLDTFGFQTDISLRVTVQKIVKMLEREDKNKQEPDRGPKVPSPGNGPPTAFFGGPGGGPPGSNMKISHTGGNVSISNVANVVNNTDSGNTYTNTIINKGNTSTINGSFNRGGDTVKNDYSVKMGNNTNFSGASGINFGSHNTNTIRQSS